MIIKMSARIPIYSLLVSAIFLFSGCSIESYESKFTDRMRENLDRIKTGDLEVHGALLHNPQHIIEIYDDDGMIRPRWKDWENADQLLNSIRNARNHGLQPEDYHLSVLYDLIDKIIVSGEKDFAGIAAFDLLLTDSFLLLSSHLARGKTTMVNEDQERNAVADEPAENRINFLENALARNRIFEDLEKLAPAHHEYIKLREALQRYRVIEENGGWTRIMTGEPKLEAGMRHPDIKMLRDRLSVYAQHTDIPVEDVTLFDDELHEQVMLFQERNGLAADGIARPSTIEAMNVSVYDRISTIKVNLERWRKLHDPGDHYIMVNIPEYVLRVVKDGRQVFTSPVIVGRPERKTPVISSRLTRLEFNPYWFVPPRMLWQDIVPAARKNENYFQDRNIEILDENWERIDPGLVDWDGASNNGSRYIVRQNPGPRNEMGRIKFLFPNRNYITIHDTPYNHLFQRHERALSSGCIRIRVPVQLAGHVLNGQDEWTIEKILQILDGNSFKKVELAEPLPIHVLYFTAWAGEGGLMHFRKDIYNYDAPLLQALEQPAFRHDHEISVQMPSGMAGTISNPPVRPGGN
jgi:L,D-transpeptidase YcbB